MARRAQNRRRNRCRSEVLCQALHSGTVRAPPRRADAPPNDAAPGSRRDPSASGSKAARPDRSVRANRREYPLRSPSGSRVRRQVRLEGRCARRALPWRRFLGEPGRNLMRDLRRSRAKRDIANRAVRHRDVNSFHGNFYANRWLRIRSSKAYFFGLRRLAGLHGASHVRFEWAT